MVGLMSAGTPAMAGLTSVVPAPTTALTPAPTTTATVAVQPKLQLIKSDRSAHLFSSSDDKAVVKQIISTHSPDGREIDTRSLLRLVEDILQRATPTVIVVINVNVKRTSLWIDRFLVLDGLCKTSSDT